MTRLIIDLWPQSFRDNYGGDWPEHYCCFDVETMGLEQGIDLPFEIGHCLVRERQIVDRTHILIDWTRDPGFSAAWIEARMETRGKELAIEGLGRITVKRLRRDGLAPDKAGAFLADFFGALREREIPLVAHNGYAFDEPVMKDLFERVGQPWPDLGPNGLIDTAMIELGNMLLAKGQPKIPMPGDSLRAYFTRMRRYKGQAKHNLSDHCRQKYNLPGRPDEYHHAEHDAVVLHHLMEAWRPGIQAVPESRLTPEKVLHVPTPVRRRRQRNR